MKMTLDRRLLTILEREIHRIEMMPWFQVYETYRLYNREGKWFDLQVDHDFWIQMPVEQHIWFYNLTLYEQVTVLIFNMLMDDVESKRAWMKDMAGKLGRAAAEWAEKIFKEAQWDDEHESKIHCSNPGASENNGSRRQTCISGETPVGE
jgi:hypothetical protein